MGKGYVAILGATSTVGRALAAHYAREGFDILLAGRQEDEVHRVGQDLATRYRCSVRAVHLDSDSFDYPQALLALASGVAPLRGVVWALGTMHAAAAEADAALLRTSTWVNFGAAVAAVEGLLPHVAPSGFIVLLSSVAGERGRARNYIYGASKAALTTYGAGLNHRFAGHGPRVTVVQLGVVDSQMTWGMDAGMPGADPEEVAAGIARAVAKGRSRAHVPKRWGLIMFVLRLLPEAIFNRLRI